ncbi:MAG: type ISP restriction/modification enzyme [Aliidongia sp.]
MESIANFSGIIWRDCPSEWHKPLLPAGQGDFAEWPSIEILFPLSLNGAQFKRHWPIGETVELLEARWGRLINSKQADRKKLFRETGGWKITKVVSDELPGKGQPSVYSADKTTEMPTVIPFSYRSFDRHLVLYDFRLGDRLRPPLWRLHGAGQTYFTSLLSNSLGFGQGLVACCAIPDLHHFRGSFGSKDVIPLYRDAAGTEPNVTGGLLDALGKEYRSTPSAENLAAYVYAVLGGQSYTRRFWNELERPGPRVPLTKDGIIFAETAKLGRKLIWLHTYAERFRGEDRGEEVPQGNATTIKGVSSDTAHYPIDYGYDPATKEIAVGGGRFGPVAPALWEFEVSGLKVVQSWLGYRMKKRAGKKSSPLDDIRPERWTARMSDEFLELLWVLEATLEMEPELEAALDQVVADTCFTAAELPTPKPEERKAPGSVSAAGALLGLMGIDQEDSDVAADGDDD